jgi:ATPase subunit of ABC transporter with duplicated ATPase domains
MDIEAIDALNNALKDFEGTLIFVSHDREFVSSLATRIIDIKEQKLVDFQGTLDEYLDNQMQAQKIA